MPKYIKFNEIKNKIFLDALSKSDARWDGKQEYFLYGPMSRARNISKSGLLTSFALSLKVSALSIIYESIVVVFGFDRGCNIDTDIGNFE